ncbi:MAG: hypothetical protein IJB42_05875, partial [Oscillospiraceae bacterium]|nr:hypothetical protein [Oscillospiraceae bacterium]
YVGSLKFSDGTIITPPAEDEEDEDDSEYIWNIADFKNFSNYSDVADLPSNWVSTNQPHAVSCEEKHAGKGQLMLENGELAWCSHEGWKMGGVNYVLDETINSGKVVISTKYQAYTGTDRFAFNMNIHAVEPPVTSYGNGTPGASHLFALSVDASGNLVLTGKASTKVTFTAGIPLDTTNRQELLIVIDFDTEKVTIETNEKTFETTFTELGHDNANLKKVWGVGFGFGYVKDTGAGWDTVGHISSFKMSDGSQPAQPVPGDDIVHDWNFADMVFSDYSDIASLPSSLVESHQNHGQNTDTAADCTAQHGASWQHLVLENGELGFSPLQTGKIGGVNYILDKTINSGKVVISTKYQAYTGTGGAAFNMNIHAEDPRTISGGLGRGNGILGSSHLFALSVDASGNLVLTGKAQTKVTFPAGISVDTTNRQSIFIVIDFDTENVTIETGGNTFETTFTALGHEGPELKKVSAVGFGFGYTDNQGVSPWNLRGYINYLKISDGAHTYDQEVIDEKYLVGNSEEHKVEYYKSCECGECSSNAPKFLALGIASAQPNLGTSISMVYNVDVKSSLAIGTPTMKFFFNDNEYSVNGVLAESETSGYTRYTFALDEIAPQCMGNLIDAELTAGSYTVKKTGYSVKAYCEAMLEKTDSSDALKTLLNDMLVYGGAAQNYLNYNTDSLVSEGITGTTFVPIQSDDKQVGTKNPAAYIAAAALRFDNTNKIRFKIVVADKANINNVTVKVDGLTVSNLEWTNDGDGAYAYVYTDEITAVGFDALHTAEITYEGTTQEVSYSVKSYVYSKQNGTDNTANLVKALYNYGLSANAYVESVA